MEERIQNEKIYNAVRKLAKERNMSLNEIACECGRASNFFYVFKYTSKGLNTLIFWKRVANALGTSLDDLIGEV